MLSLVLCIAIMLSYVSVMAFPSIDYLNINNVLQSQPMSCWAAAGSSISTYLGRPTSEAGFATATGIPLTTTVGATMSQVQGGFRQLGISGSFYSDNLSFESTQNYIAYNRKPIFGGSYQHSFALDGYSAVGGVKQLYIMDPRFGTHKYHDYNQVINYTDPDIWWVDTLTF